MARRQQNGNTSSDLAAQQQVAAAAANRQLQWIYYYQQAIVAALNASGNNLADAVAAAAAATSYNSNSSSNNNNSNNNSNNIHNNDTRSIYNSCNNGITNATSSNSLPTTTSNIIKQQFDQASLNLLESLYAMNNEPEDDAIEMIAHRLRADTFDVSNWFRARREAVASSVLLARLTAVNNSGPKLNVGASEPLYNHHIQKMIDPLEAFFMHNDSQEPAAIDMVSRRINPTFSHPAPCNAQPSAIPSSSLLAKLNAVTSRSSLDIGSTEQLDSYHHGQKSIDPLEAFFRYNDNQEPAAIDMISKRINTTFSQSAPCKTQPPAVPSSSLLAKLNAVTSRPTLNVVATKLDQKMIDLLEAFFLINDNPEPAAIEMIAKRINASADAINNWFDKKRLKLNPNAGPRSPPVKKREGGRVVTFSEYQRSLLEAIFDENNYLHPQEYEELSNLIQVPSRNIKIWFKNRRSKQRLSGRIATPCSANNSD